MTSAVTRRGLVAVAPAAIVAVSLPAIAAGAHLDAALLALRPKWRKAWRDYDDTFDPLASAEQRHREQQLPLPDRRSFQGSEAKFAMAVALVLERNESLEHEVGLKAAQERQAETCDIEWAIADEVFAIQAHTAEGIRFKLEILQAREGCESDEMEPSLRADLLRMIGIYDA